MNLKKTVKQYFNRFGLEITRYSYQENDLSWIIRNNSIGTVLDIGANVGLFSESVRSVSPEIKIYAFEPLAECYRTMLENMGRDANFKAFNFALGDQNEIKSINISPHSSSSSLLKMAKLHEDAFPHSKGGFSRQIEIKTLDDLSSSIDVVGNLLIKMDAQGYEDKIIQGGQALFSLAKVVLTEISFYPLYEGQPLFDALYCKLKELDFFYAGGTNSKKSPLDGTILFEDALFVRISDV